MRITFLVDNLPHPTLPLLTEHGLSMYIDQITPNSSLLTPNSILCDMGASGAYIKNAKALGIDLDTCHWAFLSHGHADHTGGLGKWIAQYGHIPVYASHRIATDEYFSSRPKRVESRKSKVESQCKVSAEASLLDYAEPQPDFMSEANKVESQRFNDSAIQPERSENDPFLHEIALCFVTPKGLVIVSCCSHHGALNTIASCMEFTGCNTLHAYIGGLHFVDSPEVEAETTSFIGDWLTLYPNAYLYTGHCTCPRAAAMLKAHLPHCHTFYTGNVVEV